MNMHVAILPDLATMRSTFEASKALFDAAVTHEFPGCDEWHWLRAVAHMDGENTRRNDDTTNDAAMAASATIKAAWDTYIRDLHAFYRARDGEHGVLGGRGL